MPSTIAPFGYSTIFRSIHAQPGSSYDLAPARSVLSPPRLIRRNLAFGGSTQLPPSTAYSTATSQ
ncbi:hypothetical protein [Nonomuraea sp. NEAU-A123]|uniref:hypothetical protein n=1 Tax=Nonomuraea sp. NEAU-A123 TaxID=2839649 RepID=UPI001BE48FBA|nr:hypothetical protein [Nonomuraea sp. NEAU-A123]MBT2234745.1 hypothetical protein [Nonomuraea sp. NEAU-A123]